MPSAKEEFSIAWREQRIIKKYLIGRTSDGKAIISPPPPMIVAALIAATHIGKRARSAAERCMP